MTSSHNTASGTEAGLGGDWLTWHAEYRRLGGQTCEPMTFTLAMSPSQQQQQQQQQTDPLTKGPADQARPTSDRAGGRATRTIAGAPDRKKKTATVKRETKRKQKKKGDTGLSYTEPPSFKTLQEAIAAVEGWDVETPAQGKQQEDAGADAFHAAVPSVQ